MRLVTQTAARPRRAIALLFLGLAACSNDSTSPEQTLASGTSSITVNAATATAFVKLGSQLEAVTGDDTTSATGWDISITPSVVALNVAGGVTAYCLCEHEADTDATIMALTADGQLSAFDAVSANSIPTLASFDTSAFSAPHKWYRYNLTGNDHQIWPTFNNYLVRRGSAIYKVQFIGYYDAAGSPRQITLRAAQLAQ